MISMRNSRFCVLIAFCWLVSDSCEGGALTVKGPKCGTLYCKSDQFCSQHEMQCESCSDHCNATHRNYDEGLCITGCQGESSFFRTLKSEPPELIPHLLLSDFLHDVRYARSNHGAGKLKLNWLLRDSLPHLPLLFFFWCSLFRWILSPSKAIESGASPIGRCPCHPNR